MNPIHAKSGSFTEGNQSTIHKYNIASFYSQLGQTLEVAIESFKTDKNQEGKRNLLAAETSPAAAHRGSHVGLVLSWESSERKDRLGLFRAGDKKLHESKQNNISENESYI